MVALDAVAFTQLHSTLRSVLATLSEREAGIVRLRYGLADGQPRTLDQIGPVYGLTLERIRQETACCPLQDNMNDTRSGGADLRRMRRPNRALDPRMPSRWLKATGRMGSRASAPAGA